MSEGFGGVNFYPASQDSDGMPYLDFLVREGDVELFPNLAEVPRVSDVQAVS